MGTQVGSDKVAVVNILSPIANQTDGLGVIKNTSASINSGVAHDGLVAVSNGDACKVLDPSLLCEVFEDFIGGRIIALNGTADGDQGPFTRKLNGTPTTGGLIVGDADCGQLALSLAATSEAENIAIYWNDEQCIDSDSEPVVIFRLSIDATFSAGTDLVFGFADAYNATNDSVTYNAWFKIAGASLALEMESDDNSTDTDDKTPDTAVTLTAATMYEFKVSLSAADGASTTNVKYFYRATLGGDWTPLTVGGTTFKMAADQALQPFIMLSKASGTGVGACKVDYIRCYWKRGAIT